MKELNSDGSVKQNLEISHQNGDPILQPCTSSTFTEHKQLSEEEQEKDDLTRLLLPNVAELPTTPPSAVEANFTTYYAPGKQYEREIPKKGCPSYIPVALNCTIYISGSFAIFPGSSYFLKPGHDQYVHRHANGLCVIGLAPTHVAFKDKGGVTSIDFNVGKSDRSGIKVTGKRKKNAQHFESNTALCKVCTTDSSYIVRCCVKGSLLEVNDRLIKLPELLNSLPDREGYIAIIMPRPADWLKAKSSLLGYEEYKKLRTEL